MKRIRVMKIVGVLCSLLMLIMAVGCAERSAEPIVTTERVVPADREHRAIQQKLDDGDELTIGEMEEMLAAVKDGVKFYDREGREINVDNWFEMIGLGFQKVGESIGSAFEEIGGTDFFQGIGETVEDKFPKMIDDLIDQNGFLTSDGEFVSWVGKIKNVDAADVSKYGTTLVNVGWKNVELDELESPNISQVIQEFIDDDVIPDQPRWRMWDDPDTVEMKRYLSVFQRKDKITILDVEYCGDDLYTINVIVASLD